MKKFLKKATEKLSVLDLSQTQRLFADLLEELELKDGILDSFNEGIILLDSAHRVLFMNKSVSSHLSLNFKRNFKGRSVGELIVDSDVTDFLSTCWRRKDEVGKEFTYQNGETVRIINVAVINQFIEFHEQRCDLIKISDITEERIKANKLKLNESLAQMTTMAAGVAHEIKNPLGSISLYLQLLRREYKKKESLTSQQAEKYLSVIGEEIERLNSIVVDFLFAVRPLSVNLRKESVNDLVKDIADFVLPELKENHIVLDLSLEPGLPKLNIDSSLFRQAALNLIKNSIQAIESRFLDRSQGRLGIETKLNNNSVDVVFSDNGCGIPDSKLSKIFEPYYTTKDTGTGLGLTVLFKIVKEHQGNVNVISKENEGTAFILSFPVPRDERMKITYQDDSGKVAYEENDTDSRR